MAEQLRIDTPESTSFELDTAGVGSRFAALLIDMTLQAILAAAIVFGLAYAAESTGNPVPDTGLIRGLAIALIVFLMALPFLGYSILLELLWNGQTLGKRALGLRVVTSNGLPAGAGPIVARNLLRLVDFLPFAYAAGVTCMLTTRHYQRLGDLVAGTIVVRERREALPTAPSAPPLTPERAAYLAALAGPARILSDADLEPIRTFLARRARFTRLRRAALARSLCDTYMSRLGGGAPAADPEGFLVDLLLCRSSILAGPKSMETSSLLSP